MKARRMVAAGHGARARQIRGRKTQNRARACLEFSKTFWAQSKVFSKVLWMWQLEKNSFFLGIQRFCFWKSWGKVNSPGWEPEKKCKQILSTVPNLLQCFVAFSKPAMSVLGEKVESGWIGRSRRVLWSARIVSILTLWFTSQTSVFWKMFLVISQFIGSPMRLLRSP